MSIFFVKAKAISRGNGQNAVACAAYRSGEKLYDKTEDKEHDYTRKEGIIETGISAPEGAPEWMTDRGKLWEAVEEQENRKDSRLSREFVVAIPHELKDNAAEITKELVSQLNREGMVVDWSIHEPGREGDERNVHAHLMTTLRRIDGNEFAEKQRDWDKHEFLDKVKEGFCKTFNRELLEKGLEPVDWRSYEAQGITDRTPQEHQGVEKTAITRREARELVRLEKRIKAKEKEIENLEINRENRRSGNEPSRDERGTSRIAENDRGEKDRTGKRDTPREPSDIERTIHDIEDRARRGLTADEQRTERERQTARERNEQLSREREASERSREREREANERSRERDRGRGGISR